MTNLIARNPLTVDPNFRFRVPYERFDSKLIILTENAHHLASSSGDG